MGIKIENAKNSTAYQGKERKPVYNIHPVRFEVESQERGSNIQEDPSKPKGNQKTTR